MLQTVGKGKKLVEVFLQVLKAFSVGLHLEISIAGVYRFQSSYNVIKYIKLFYFFIFGFHHQYLAHLTD